MRIVYLTAGAASRYCGTCMHDNTLARALLAQGEQVLLVPTYTPLRTDEENVSLPRVFFGGVNVYLQQQSALFRHTPWFIDRLARFSQTARLAFALQRRHGSGQARRTHRFDAGRASTGGNARKSRSCSTGWQPEAKPEVIHLSNALLLGMAARLRRAIESADRLQSGRRRLAHRNSCKSRITAAPANCCASAPPTSIVFVAYNQLLRRFHGRLFGGRSQPHRSDPPRFASGRA